MGGGGGGEGGGREGGGGGVGGGGREGGWSGGGGGGEEGRGRGGGGGEGRGEGERGGEGRGRRVEGEGGGEGGGRRGGGGRGGGRCRALKVGGQRAGRDRPSHHPSGGGSMAPASTRRAISPSSRPRMSRQISAVCWLVSGAGSHRGGPKRDPVYAGPSTSAWPSPGWSTGTRKPRPRPNPRTACPDDTGGRLARGVRVGAGPRTPNPELRARRHGRSAGVQFERVVVGRAVGLAGVTHPGRPWASISEIDERGHPCVESCSTVRPPTFATTSPWSTRSR